MVLIDFLSMCAYFSVSSLLGIVGINSPQAYRPILFAGLASFAILALGQISSRIWVADIFAMFILIYVSHMSCVLCVDKYVLPRKPGVGFDWVGGYKMLFNARWIGTNRQVSDINIRPRQGVVSPPQGTQREDSRHLPKNFGHICRSPRTLFVLNCVMSVAFTLAAEKIYGHFSTAFLQQYLGGLEITDFLPTKETYFRRIGSVTIRETVIRVWVITFAIGSGIGFFNIAHNILAIIFVGTGFDEPEDWPPLFGNIQEASSIRNYWAKFWHRLVYRSYTSHGIWISKNILRLPRSSFIGKLFINLYVFAASGAVHALATRQARPSCGYWKSAHFYVLNFFAILLETVVLAAFSKATKGYKVNSTVSKTIGYFWVFMFFFWAIPKHQYSQILCDP
jgi:hypothetical protein